MTPLDQAHAAMLAGDEASRLRFYGAIASAELFLVLEREADGDTVTPQVFPLEDGPVVLAFDTEARLTEAVGPSAYVALSGRTLAGMLSAQALGLILNAGVAPSEFAMDAEAVAWLARTDATITEAVARPVALHPPHSAGERTITSLSEGLARAEGLAQAAWLADAEYEGGERALLLTIVGAPEGAEAALRRAIGEVQVFSEGEPLDLLFAKDGDAILRKLERVALRFDIPEPPPAIRRDPEAPPRLR